MQAPRPVGAAAGAAAIVFGIALAGMAGCGSTEIVKPTASAGSDTTGAIAQPTQLDGSKSAPAVTGGQLTFEWSFVALPAGSQSALNNGGVVNPSFVPDVAGTYTVRLVVTEGEVDSDPAFVNVTVGECGSAAPTVATPTATPSAPGIGQPVELAVEVADGDNNDGCKRGQSVTPSWAFVALPAGSRATINDPAAVNPSFVPDVAGDYTLSVQATDSTGRTSATATVSVTASTCGTAPPMATAIVATPAAPRPGEATGLAATVDDADNAERCAAGQTFGYAWRFESLPAGSAAALVPATGATPIFIPDQAGDYVISLTVTDSTGRSSAPATATVSVSGCGLSSPTVISSVAAPEAPNIGDLVSFTLAVDDADNDPATCALGQLLTVTSTFAALPAGSTATLTPASGLTPAFRADVAGAYTVRSTVIDSTGRAAMRDTTVTVSTCGGAAPTVAATASPQTVNIGDRVTFALTATDADNGASCGLAQTATFKTAFLARPAGSTATIDPSEGDTPSFVADIAGTFILRTTVTDDTGRSSTTDTSITVTTCGGAAPVVGDVQVTPASPYVGALVALAITVDDADNATACAQSQPLDTVTRLTIRPAGSGATLSPAEGLTPAFRADVPGDYGLRITVIDSTGRSTTRDETVTVGACGSAVPVAELGVSSPVIAGPSPRVTLADIEVGLTVALDASASTDADSACLPAPEVLSYRWFFTAKPAGSGATFNDPDIAAPSFEPDVPGTYRLGVRVSDGTHDGYAYLTLDAVPSVVFGSNTGFTLTLVGSGALWNHPEGLALAPDGSVYVVQNGSSAITRTTNLGGTAVTVPFSRGGYLQGIHDVAYIAASSALFVTSRTLNTIVKVDATGQQTSWSSTGGGGGGGASLRPYGIATFKTASDQDRLLVGNSNGRRVDFFNPASTAPASSVGSDDFGGNLEQVWGVAGLVSGGVNYYFATDDGNGELWRTDGTTDRRLSNLLQQPHGVVVSPSGKLIVADSAAGILAQIDNCAAGSCAYTALAWGDWQPWGLAFTTAGELLVTDRQGNALYRVKGPF